MKKLTFIVGLLLGTSFFLQAQKSKVFAVFQLIEDSKYKEAKVIIEEAITEERTKKWPRTWYARGLICHNAYRDGRKNDDKDLYELYPDQLYVAFSSYERTRYLDKRGRYDKRLAPLYVLLSNDFKKLGEKLFSNKKYDEALRAFEYALRINRNSLLSIPLDTNLLYNAALTAYKCSNWKDAIDYLETLNEGNYSPNVPHLLFSVHMEQKDTTKAEQVLLEGIKNYKENENLVLLLVDLFYRENNAEKAVKILDDAFSMDTANYIFPYTKGLLYQKMEQYEKAINVYKEALTIPTDTVKLYTSIGTCYYNIGAEIEKKARTISNIRVFQKEKEKAEAAFESAIYWFEKAHKMNGEDQEIITKLYQLYKILGNSEKLRDLKEKRE